MVIVYIWKLALRAVCAVALFFLGFVGIFLPVVPTFSFWLLAVLVLIGRKDAVRKVFVAWKKMVGKALGMFN